jgi:hypothetical protein
MEKRADTAADVGWVEEREEEGEGKRMHSVR